MEKIKECPFCNYDEGWVQDQAGKFFVQCKVCNSKGPEAKNHDMARDLWNGKLSKIAPENIDSYLDDLKEEAMGGVSAPMATLNNTPGVGNAVPATQAAATGAQFTSDAVKGSGDRWDSSEPDDKKKKKKSSKTEKYKISTFDEFLKNKK